MKLFSQ